MTTELATTEPTEPTLAEVLQDEIDRLERDKDRWQEDEPSGDVSFCEWYLRELGICDAIEAKIKQQADRLCTQIRARRGTLAYLYGREFRDVVTRKIAEQPGKKKSVDFLHGRAGYRKKKASLLVRDKPQAIEWAVDHCPDAVELHLQRRTPLLEHFEATGELPPGCDYIPERDCFFPQPEDRLLDEEIERLLAPPQLIEEMSDDD